jgi:E-phenylitaconyl-CoA hydratase
MALLYEVREQIATVTLNRPEAMNSLDPGTLAELNDAFQRQTRTTTFVSWC